MSCYAVSRIQQLVSCAMHDSLGSLVLHTEEIEQVLSWLANDHSKAQYNRELVFMVIRKLLGVESAVKYAGNVSMQTWNKAMEAGMRARESGEIPEYTLKIPEDRYPGEIGMTTTFIMNQYAYGDHVNIRKGDIFFDCGACYGDSSLWALKKGASKAYLFEPGLESFVLCQKNMRLCAPENSAQCENIAVGDKDGKVRFNYVENSPSGSVLHPKGALEVDMVRIDSYCESHDVVPSFIKMDLEGGEPLALIGAQKTIRAHAPQLAISLYHDLTHMWQIPILIKQIRSDYVFWCKKNNPWHEFVLYAVATAK